LPFQFSVSAARLAISHPRSVKALEWRVRAESQRKSMSVSFCSFAYTVFEGIQTSWQKLEGKAGNLNLRSLKARIAATAFYRADFQCSKPSKPARKWRRQ